MSISDDGAVAMSAQDKDIAVNGDMGQAEGLLGKKKGFGGKKGK